MLNWCPLIVATAVPLTRLLMNGAFEFWKICWMGPENWLAGCVQLWFSMAITKTVLIERSSSAPAAVTVKAAVRQPKSIAYFIWYPRVVGNTRSVRAAWLSYPPRTHLRQG